MTNRLAHETSPYLIQHQNNPVDWYPWGDEAFALARTQQKPVLLSIGYAACHWCHVMAHESFEDVRIATQMNRDFVCIKVDREERPDIDAIYMDAVQAISGHGGWPLTAFLTPTGEPFYAGTYFPPTPRHGLASFSQVLSAVTDAWVNQREELVTSAKQLRDHLAQATNFTPADQLTQSLLDSSIEMLDSSFDRQYGGFGNAPKFPPTCALEFLLQRAVNTNADCNAAVMALDTLRAMARGGIYDQIGGGFSRYSVDETWTVPHFEKMLYDNALLARTYLHAGQLTGDKLFYSICCETLDWALRELCQPDGGFASSLDADSEGVEGKFYLWTLDEIRSVLPPEAAQAAISYFGMTERGNFDGRNIPVGGSEVPAGITAIKQQLYDARAKRTWPALDDKRVTAWNALMVQALAQAGSVLERADYLSAATRCASFILNELRDSQGRLLRTYNHGRAHLQAYLEDHAYLLEALLTLYEVTFDSHWFVTARQLAETILDRFADPAAGGFFATADDHEVLIARRKELQDSPTPSGNASAAFGLLRLGALTGEQRFIDAAVGALKLAAPLTQRYPVAFGHSLAALDFHITPTQEVALVGPDIEPLLRAIHSKLRPHMVLAGGDPAGVALLEGRSAVDGKATAYVCENFSCLQPVTTATELETLLQ